MKIQTKTGQPIGSSQTSSNVITGGFVNQATNYSTEDTFGRISFLNFALITPSSGNASLEEIEVKLVAEESNSTVITFVVKLPGYFQRAIYDPNFGVVLGRSDSDGDG